MTPVFWKYLITNFHGSGMRVVADADRDWAEKELESDSHLLRYAAQPQFASPAFRHPARRVLQRLLRIRSDLQTMEVNKLHDSVVTINSTPWPAYRKENGTLVDLRILDPEDDGPKPQLVFLPAALRESGIPEALIQAAAQSNPPGLVLFKDLPRFKGCSDQPTTEKPHAESD